MDPKLLDLLRVVFVIFAAAGSLDAIRRVTREAFPSARLGARPSELLRWKERRWPRWLCAVLTAVEAALFLVGLGVLGLVLYLRIVT